MVISALGSGLPLAGETISQFRKRPRSAAQAKIETDSQLTCGYRRAAAVDSVAEQLAAFAFELHDGDTKQESLIRTGSYLRFIVVVRMWYAPNGCNYFHIFSMA